MRQNHLQQVVAPPSTRNKGNMLSLASPSAVPWLRKPQGITTCTTYGHPWWPPRESAREGERKILPAAPASLPPHYIYTIYPGVSFSWRPRYHTSRAEVSARSRSFCSASRSTWPLLKFHFSALPTDLNGHKSRRISKSSVDPVRHPTAYQTTSFPVRDAVVCLKRWNHWPISFSSVFPFSTPYYSTCDCCIFFSRLSLSLSADLGSLKHRLCTCPERSERVRFPSCRAAAEPAGPGLCPCRERSERDRFTSCRRAGRSRKTRTLQLHRAERAGSLPKLPRRRRAGRASTLPLPRAERAGSLHELPPSRPWQENTDSEIAQSGASGFASQAAADQQNTNSTLAKSGGSGIAYYYYLLDFSYYVLNFSFKISAATTSYFIY